MKSKGMFILRVVCILAISIWINRYVMQPNVVQPLMEILTKYNLLGVPVELWFITVLIITWAINLFVSCLIMVGLEEFDAVTKGVPSGRSGGANAFIYWLLPIIFLMWIHLDSTLPIDSPLIGYGKVIAGLALVAWIIGYFNAREKAEELERAVNRLENQVNGLATHKKSGTPTVSVMQEKLLVLRLSILSQRIVAEKASNRSDFRSHELVALEEQQIRLDSCVEKIGYMEEAIALLEKNMLGVLVLHFGDGVYMKQGGGWYERDVYFDKKKYLAEFNEGGALIRLIDV
ncbi:hypothetical protein EP56_01690 [Listeriaceae bacterium FSL A5-0209]|nr:hypothetical protein EP56_01690 [Listeriaceae bacterium FSL A5-0209]